MKKKVETEIKVGLFVSIGVGLIMVAILILGGGETILSGSVTYGAHFKSVEGLISGAKVVLSGVPVGSVTSISLDQKEKNVRVVLTIKKDSSSWIRQNATLEIATQGVLGDKYVNINGGTDDQPILPPGSNIPIVPPRDLTQFISKGDQLVGTINSVAVQLNVLLKAFEAEYRSETFFKGIASTAKNLSLLTDKLNHQFSHLEFKEAVSNMNQIFEKINNGTGTLGALVNDSGLYDQLQALLGGASRNRLVRNIVRQTVRDSEEPKSQPSPIPKK